MSAEAREVRPRVSERLAVVLLHGPERGPKQLLTAEFPEQGSPLVRVKVWEPLRDAVNADPELSVTLCDMLADQLAKFTTPLPATPEGLKALQYALDTISAELWLQAHTASWH